MHEDQCIRPRGRNGAPDRHSRRRLSSITDHPQVSSIIWIMRIQSVARVGAFGTCRPAESGFGCHDVKPDGAPVRPPAPPVSATAPCRSSRRPAASAVACRPPLRDLAARPVDEARKASTSPSKSGGEGNKNVLASRQDVGSAGPSRVVIGSRRGTEHRRSVAPPSALSEQAQAKAGSLWPGFVTRTPSHGCTLRARESDRRGNERRGRHGRDIGSTLRS